MPVKILASNNYVDEIEVGNNEVIYRLPKEELPIEYDDCAIINTKLYDDLFGKLRRESKKNDKLLSLDDTIDKYLELPAHLNYPSIKL